MCRQCREGLEGLVWAVLSCLPRVTSTGAGSRMLPFILLILWRLLGGHGTNKRRNNVFQEPRASSQSHKVGVVSAAETPQRGKHPRAVSSLPSHPAELFYPATLPSHPAQPSCPVMLPSHPAQPSFPAILPASALKKVIKTKIVTYLPSPQKSA